MESLVFPVSRGWPTYLLVVPGRGALPAAGCPPGREQPAPTAPARSPKCAGDDFDGACSRGFGKVGRGPPDRAHRGTRWASIRPPPSTMTEGSTALARFASPRASHQAKFVHHFEGPRLAFEGRGGHVLASGRLESPPGQADHRSQLPGQRRLPRKGAEAVSGREAFPAAPLAARARGPYGSTTMCPISLPNRARHRRAGRSSRTRPPIPVPSVTITTWSCPCAAPRQCPAKQAAAASFHTYRRRPCGAAPGELGAQVDAVDAMEVRAKLGDSLPVDHPRAADAEGRGWAGPLSGRTRLSTDRTASTISAAERRRGSLSTASTWPAPVSCTSPCYRIPSPSTLLLHHALPQPQLLDAVFSTTDPMPTPLRVGPGPQPRSPPPRSRQPPVSSPGFINPSLIKPRVPSALIPVSLPQVPLLVSPLLAFRWTPSPGLSWTPSPDSLSWTPSPRFSLDSLSWTSCTWRCRLSRAGAPRAGRPVGHRHPGPLAIGGPISGPATAPRWQRSSAHDGEAAQGGRYGLGLSR